MAERFNFTKQKLTKLEPAAKGKRLYVYDTKVNGLCLSVTDAGTKSFLVYRKLHGRPVRATLGHFPDMTIEQARKSALSALSKIAGGVNPIDEKKEAIACRISLQEVFDEYIKTRTNLKVGTIYDYRKAVNESFSTWLKKPMASITRDMVKAKHRKRGQASKARANNAFRVLRALFNFAKVNYRNSKGLSLFPDNPVEVLSDTKAWFKVERRRTYIHKKDLPRWFQAVQKLSSLSVTNKSDAMSDYLLFLLFTGVRREEALKLKWSEVDLDEATLTLIDPKNRKTVVLPLCDYLCDLLRKRRTNIESLYVFPGEGSTGHLAHPQKHINLVRENADVYFSSHCLRRTFATIAESLDIGTYTIKGLLNHKINYQTDPTAGYIVHDLERLRKASNQVEEYILESVKFKTKKRRIKSN